MTYTPLNWTNEIPESVPVKFKITDDTAGEIAASANIEMITPAIPGTAFNANNLNHMETGIKDANDTAASAVASIQGALDAAAQATAAAQAASSQAQAAQSTADGAVARSVLTAAGDLLTASGAAAPARLAVGANGKRLAVVNGVPTWALPLGASKIASGVQTISNDLVTAVTLGVLEWDGGGYSGTGSLLKIPDLLGYTSMYHVSCMGYFNGTASGYTQLGFRWGSPVKYCWQTIPITNGVSNWHNVNAIIALDPGQTVEMVALQVTGGSLGLNFAHLALFQL